jgi:FixJ family two-component response regulator
MIYIVDDDDSVRASLVRLVRSAGRPARSFATAEAFLDEAPDARGAVVVIDVHLPGMSGLELQRELVRRGIDFPVVMMTALEDPDVRRAALGAGVLGLLIKPFSESSLLELLEQASQGDTSVTDV